MKKKLIALLLCIALGVTGGLMLTGCQTKETDEVKIFGIAAGVEDDALNNNDVATLVKEYTGTNVKYFQASSDSATAQNQLTNIFTNKLDYHGVVVTKQFFYSMMEQGGLADISSYVENSTNLKTVIGAEGWAAASKDGKIYGIPQKDAKKANNLGFAYREDLLTAYNTANPDAKITVPSEENGYSMTTAEFKTYLQYVKTSGGDSISGLPLTVDKGNPYLEPIMTAFGIYQEWADVNNDKKLEHFSQQAGFADYLNYVNELYAAGLINYQTDTTGAVAAIKIGENGKAVSAVGRVAHWNPASYEGDAGNEKYAYIAALIPEAEYANAAAKKAAVRVWANEGYGYFTVIPKHVSAHKQELAMKYFDKKLDADFFKLMTIGEKDVHYTVDTNGDYYPIIPKFNDRNISDKYLNGTREADYAKYWMCRVRKTAAQYKMFSRANFTIDTAGIKNPIAIMPPVADYDTNYGARDAKVKEQMILSMFPASGENRVSPESIVTLYKSGTTISGATKTGDEITTAVNAWYTPWVDGAGATYNTVKPR